MTLHEAGGWTIELVQHLDVMPLRMAVLRPGQPYDASRYVGEETGINVAARLGGVVVGCATFIPAPFAGAGEEGAPDDADPPEGALGLVAWRLRGMATAPQLRGRGIGSDVLVAGLAAAASAGAGLVWCNARTRALEFYRRHGFETVGSEFLTGGAQPVPHFRAWVPLLARSPPALG